jgi:hypothetical protein
VFFSFNNAVYSSSSYGAVGSWSKVFNYDGYMACSNSSQFVTLVNPSYNSTSLTGTSSPYNIFISTNYGASGTWYTAYTSGTSYGGQCSMSATGQYQYVTNYGGSSILISTNYGAVGSWFNSSIGYGVSGWNVATSSTVQYVFCSTYGGAAGYLAGGYAINPFLVMLFKQPEFKTFQFSWSFSPRTEIESQTLQNVIQSFRKYMLPEAAATIALKYPNIVLVKFFPDDYLFQFKPCVIRSINVDYNPGGNPAFFKTGAPAQIRLTLDLTEIEYWLQSDLQIPG